MIWSKQTILDFNLQTSVSNFKIVSDFFFFFFFFSNCGIQLKIYYFLEVKIIFSLFVITEALCNTFKHKIKIWLC